MSSFVVLSFLVVCVKCLWKWQFTNASMATIKNNSLKISCSDWFSTLIANWLNWLFDVSLATWKSCSRDEEVFCKFTMNICWNMFTTQCWRIFLTIHTQQFQSQISDKLSMIQFVWWHSFDNKTICYQNIQHIIKTANWNRFAFRLKSQFERIWSYLSVAPFNML